MKISTRDVLGAVFGAPFLKDAKFYFAVWNVFVVFSWRAGVSLTAQEIGIVNMLIATVFGISPPTFTYFQQMRMKK